VERLPDPGASNVVFDPSMADLRSFSAHLETTTEYGSPAYVSENRSRSADRTKNTVDDRFDESDYDLVHSAIDLAREREVVCLDRQVGRRPDVSFTCRLYVPKTYSRIALAWAKLLEPAPDGAEPDLWTVQFPEYGETAVRVLPDEGFTAVLGSDYTGEAKKSFLRLFMYAAKRQGGLGLHAGSKRVQVCREGERAGDGSALETVGQVFLGLSGTGKSTLTAHGLGLEDPEEATMLQDDVCALLSDGSVAGSEGQGLYVKTIGLEPTEQPALYRGVTHESAVLENVAVADDGAVDFDDPEHTSNARAVIQRDQLGSAAEEIDLQSVDQFFFITRNPLMAPVAKLTDEQAAAAFMFGESIRTSAGDPDRAGETVRVVGTNPFIIGPEGAEGNRFYDLVSGLGVDCYLLNTGHVGDPDTARDDVRDIGVDESVAIVRAIARNNVEWADDERTGMTLPTSVPGVAIDRYYVPLLVDDYAGRIADLRDERRNYLATFDELNEKIREAAY